MSERVRTIAEVRREGFAALRERLGVADMARFLQLFDSGSGDYTEERRVWLEGQAVDGIAARMERAQTDSPKE